MTEINHHISEADLIAYAAGNLPGPFAMIVATHVSLCDQCRAALSAHETAGGLALETLDAEPVSDDMRARLMARLDERGDPDPVYLREHKREGIYPGPVVGALNGAVPKWKPLGLGVRQAILSAGSEGSVRLLYIPPNQAVPDHGHNGLEMTLVLQGSFSDETGQFGVGDVELADATLEHTPIAGAGAPCICLAATDAPLRFRGLMPRLLQPLFRI